MDGAGQADVRRRGASLYVMVGGCNTLRCEVTQLHTVTLVFCSLLSIILTKNGDVEVWGSYSVLGRELEFV
jgi:hypothetical protein